MRNSLGSAEDRQVGPRVKKSKWPAAGSRRFSTTFSHEHFLERMISMAKTFYWSGGIIF